MKGDRGYRLLAIWYGLYQALHAALNVLYLSGRLAFPPPPAEGSWHGPVLHFFHGMGAVDLAVCALSLVFVAGALRERRWAPAVGLVSLTASLYSCAVFTYGCVASGTWKSNVGEQVVAYLAFAPVVVLFGWTWARVTRSPGV